MTAMVIPELPRLLGGRICLDFTNSVHMRKPTLAGDYLTGYAALVQWARHAGALHDALADRLARAGARDRQAADVVLARAVALREALYHIFEASMRSEAPAASDLAKLNSELSEAQRHARIVWRDGRLIWEWSEVGDQGEGADVALDRMLWPIVRSAAELLTAPELARVRQCPGPDCGWLFLDTSKNGSRQWCSMETCGNRAKARRHYSRQRSSRD